MFKVLSLDFFELVSICFLPVDAFKAFHFTITLKSTLCSIFSCRFLQTILIKGLQLFPSQL